MKNRKKFRLVFGGSSLGVVNCETGEVLYEFTLDELAEIIEFRYAIPWNKSKDILEKLTYLIWDIQDAYENLEDTLPGKDDIIRKVKLRVHQMGGNF